MLNDGVEWVKLTVSSIFELFENMLGSCDHYRPVFNWTCLGCHCMAISSMHLP